MPNCDSNGISVQNGAKFVNGVKWIRNYRLLRIGGCVFNFYSFMPKEPGFVMGCGEIRNQQGISKSQKGNKALFIFLAKLLKIHLYHGIPDKPFYHYMCCF
jgi:hypothetical protein